MIGKYEEAIECLQNIKQKCGILESDNRFFIIRQTKPDNKILEIEHTAFCYIKSNGFLLSQIEFPKYGDFFQFCRPPFITKIQNKQIIIQSKNIYYNSIGFMAKYKSFEIRVNPIIDMEGFDVFVFYKGQCLYKDYLLYYKDECINIALEFIHSKLNPQTCVAK